jgi:hypothetical protein
MAALPIAAWLAPAATQFQTSRLTQYTGQSITWDPQNFPLQTVRISLQNILVQRNTYYTVTLTLAIQLLANRNNNNYTIFFIEYLGNSVGGSIVSNASVPSNNIFSNTYVFTFVSPNINPPQNLFLQFVQAGAAIAVGDMSYTVTGVTIKADIVAPVLQEGEDPIAQAGLVITRNNTNIFKLTF